MWCDFKGFVKRKIQAKTHSNQLFSWFQLKAYITLLNRIFPGQCFCLKWIPPFISPHAHCPFAEDGSDVVQHCFTWKTSCTFMPNRSHAAWHPTLHQLKWQHTCLLVWSVACVWQYQGSITPLWPVTNTSTAWWHFQEMRSNTRSAVLQWIAVRQLS